MVPCHLQVDNFTIEELPEADGQGADDDAPAYVPSVLARPAQSKAPAPGGRVMTGASVAGVSSVAGSAVADRAAGQHTAAAAAGVAQAPKTVLPLEDEIKLRASRLRSAAKSGAGAGQVAAGVSSGALLTAADSDDEGKAEVLDGDKGAKATGGVDELLKLQGSYASRVAGGARRSTDRPAATVTTSGGVDGDEDEEQAESEAVEEEQGQSGLAQGSHGAPSEEGVVATLPGEPLATDSGADTQLISINTQDMLERMGLGECPRKERRAGGQVQGRGEASGSRWDGEAQTRWQGKGVVRLEALPRQRLLSSLLRPFEATTMALFIQM